MEYLPWGLMALGLFLLFVTHQLRKGDAVEARVTYEAHVRNPGGRTLQVNTKDLKEPAVVHAPQRSHDSVIWMPIILSLLVTGAALAVILLPSYYGEEQHKWAFGVIGLILGYWFKK